MTLKKLREHSPHSPILASIHSQDEKKKIENKVEDKLATDVSLPLLKQLSLQASNFFNPHKNLKKRKIEATDNLRSKKARLIPVDEELNSIPITIVCPHSSNISGSICNVIIKIKGSSDQLKTVIVPRFVLEYLPKLAQLIQADDCESEDPNLTISLNKFRFETVSKALSFLVACVEKGEDTLSMKESASMTALVDLYLFAYEFEFSLLKEACVALEDLFLNDEQYIEDTQLHILNCWKQLDLTDSSVFSSKLFDYIQLYLVDCLFIKVPNHPSSHRIFNPEFFNLSKEYLLVLLQDSAIQVPEKGIFFLAYAWLKHQAKQTQEPLANFLIENKPIFEKCVNFKRFKQQNEDKFLKTLKAAHIEQNPLFSKGELTYYRMLARITSYTCPIRDIEIWREWKATNPRQAFEIQTIKDAVFIRWETDPFKNDASPILAYQGQSFVITHTFEKETGLYLLYLKSEDSSFFHENTSFILSWKWILEDGTFWTRHIPLARIDYSEDFLLTAVDLNTSDAEKINILRMTIRIKTT